RCCRKRFSAPGCAENRWTVCPRCFPIAYRPLSYRLPPLKTAQKVVDGVAEGGGVQCLPHGEDLGRTDAHPLDQGAVPEDLIPGPVGHDLSAAQDDDPLGPLA